MLPDLMSEPLLDLPLTPSETMAALRGAVEAWGGGWSEEETSQEFAVPVRAGLRHGYARIRPTIDETDSGSRLQLEVQEQTLRVNRSAVMVLLMGAIGGLLTVLWPLHEALLALAPIGAVLALAAWLMVASRFRSHGAEELLGAVEEIAMADTAA